MRFSSRFLDEIRARISLSDVISQRVQLQKRGREYLGLCPFHNEKTPSFTVNNDKGFYHCFGCGAHGDAIRFITETQGLSFTEAVTQLAEQTGLPLPTPSPEEEAQEEKINAQYTVLEAACAWFESQLHSEAGTQARNYLKGRNVQEDIIRQFRLGFAPDNRQMFLEAMHARGFDDAALLEAGLAIKPDEGTPYARFRRRIIFPIMDSRGQVIAFGGRILGDGEPKYLNSPETPTFQKSYVLYGWHLARQRAYEKKSIVAVEGYMDVIALHKAGITNAVAPLGTALTEQHVQLMWKTAKEPVICMDGDAAGMRAMHRAAEHFLPLLTPGKSLKFAFLPEGQDPDDVISKRGIQAMRDLLLSAKPLSECIWDLALSQQKLDTPEQKAALEAQLMQRVETIRDASIKQHYRQFFKDKIWQMKRQKNQPHSESHKRAHNLAKLSIKPRLSKQERYAATLLWLVLSHPDLLHEDDIMEDFSRLECANPESDSLRTAIEDITHTTPDITSISLRETLENKGLAPHLASIDAVKPPHEEENTTLAAAHWRYIHALHALTLMEHEYETACATFQNSVTEENQERLMELKKHMEYLEQRAAHEKVQHEMLLDVAAEKI